METNVRKKIFIGVILLMLIGGGLFFFRYLAVFEKSIPIGVKQGVSESEENEVPERGVSSAPESDAAATVEIEIETVVAGLVVPWSMAFTDDKRMLITERGGELRVFENNSLRQEPLYVFEEVVSTAEEGLMGLALDPEYAANHFFYVSLAYKKGNGLAVKVVRLRDDGERAVGPEIIIDDIPATTFHAGSRIMFGPDKLLYITTGDATDKKTSQDLKSLGGKTLRIHPDGSIPSDNPFPGSPVWSYGHRNSQGMAWHPVAGEMYATEHGPSVFDGPAGGDEINHIQKGKNYGWPLVSHRETRIGTDAPLLVFTPAEAPAGATFYASDTIPQFTNQFFFAALKGEGIFRVAFDQNDPNKVKEYEKLPDIDFGRIRDVHEGPDGALYFMTSNRDGRGNPVSSDDRILRIVTKSSK